MIEVIFFFLLLFLGNLAQLYLFITMILYLFISFTGVFLYIKNESIDFKKNKKFAVLIPAHNEENVISNLLDSIDMLDYPEDLYDVFVICDHCSDKTKEIVSNYDVGLLEYNDRFPSNKARALNRAIDDILRERDIYDAFCYFDADSLVHPDFLKAMAGYLSSGAKVIQAQQLPKNPDESFLSVIISSGQFITNKFFQKPKNMLGLSATLHGKGMCFDTDTVKRFRWDENCLTEDLEMQMRLIENGIRIYWSEKAIVFDEEPIMIRQYLMRSIRWTRGSLDTAKKHASNLFKLFFKKLDFKMLEAFVYCFGVYRVIIVVFVALAMYLTRNEFNLLIYCFRLIPYEALISKLLFLVMPFVILPFMILLDKKIGFNMFVGYFLQPALGFFRIPIFLFGIAKDRELWNRTEHTSKVKITDIINNR
jgi:cellulose synthase/poly-beta-1,6-N-acetylglucosamine synthase-like glycosyltransferase